MSSHNTRTPYMLSDRHFMLTLAVALLLHVSGFVAWSFAPKQQVRDIVIRSMNIRLGDEDEENISLEKPDNFSPNAPQVDAIIDQITRDNVVPQQPPKADNDSAKQYVREVNAPRKKGLKSGNARDAEIVSRYTQQTSLWIKKFQRYPEMARLQGLQGTPVVRIRIDRRGNIVYYALEKSSGVPALDLAAIEMIRRANPVPAVPSDYSSGNLLEFLIPVIFKLS